MVGVSRCTRFACFAVQLRVLAQKSLKFLCGSPTAIFSAMTAILKDEEFVAIEQAVQASTAPAEMVAAFNELSALREQLKKFGEPESYYLKAMNCPQHPRIFEASRLCCLT